MNDNKLAQDEAQRAANYEAIKSDVSRNVGGEILAESRQSNAAEINQVEDLAAGMKQKAAREVRQTEREVGMGRAAARVSQVVDYIFFLIYGLLVIRLLLELFAARQSAGFFEFIKSATGTLYSPFRGLVASPSTAEGYTLALPIIVAIIVYAFLHLAINRLLSMFAHRKTEV